MGQSVRVDTDDDVERNVCGGPLQECGTEPLTGFFRDGCCRTGPDDLGSHTICAVMTPEFLAHQRSDAADRQPGTVGVVTTLLREWLKEPVPDSAIAGSVAVALERVVGVTQVRFPRIADLARGVAYAWFALPVLRRDRARVYTDVRKSLLYLDQHPDAADRAERIARQPQPPSLS